MAKQVTNVARCPSIANAYTPGPNKEVMVVACDDGAIYEFQKFEDAPHFDMKARGSRKKPVHDWTHSRAVLPSNVKEQLDEILGEKGWTK